MGIYCETAYRNLQAYNIGKKTKCHSRQLGLKTSSSGTLLKGVYHKNRKVQACFSPCTRFFIGYFDALHKICNLKNMLIDNANRQHFVLRLVPAQNLIKGKKAHFCFRILYISQTLLRWDPSRILTIEIPQLPQTKILHRVQRIPFQPIPQDWRSRISLYLSTHWDLRFSLEMRKYCFLPFLHLLAI